MAFCGACGAAVPPDNAFCNACGKTVGSTPGAVTATAARRAPAEEKKFFENARVLVTNSRCVIDGETFAMSGITSVTAFTESPSRKGPVITALVGCVVALVNLQSNTIGVLFGVGIIALGIVWFISIKDIHNVLIKSASGEAKPLHHTDREYILQVVDALNQTIVYRN